LVYSGFISSSFFSFRANAIMRHVKFSMRCGCGKFALVLAYIFHAFFASGSSFASSSGSHWLASDGDSVVECRSGEPEWTGDEKELAVSVPYRDVKRLSEMISLYMEELVSDDWGESLKLGIHDGP
jgi:hypothetical protein